jgi:hypothetical protein
MLNFLVLMKRRSFLSLTHTLYSLPLSLPLPMVRRLKSIEAQTQYACICMNVCLRSFGGVGPVRGLRGGGKWRVASGVGQERLGPS